MPLTPQMMRLLHIAIVLQSFAIALLMFVLILSWRATPEQVLNEVKALRSDVQINRETVRTAMTVSEKELEKLKEKMEQRSESLEQAQQTLMPESLP